VKYAPNYHIACGIQRKILEQIGVGPDAPPKVSKLSPKDLAVLTSAWEKLEERKRILRNKPLPKAAEVKPKGSERKRETFTE
jgi:hypothetical protein